jgi:O-antigen/teichoic acid export membrane protein
LRERIIEIGRDSTWYLIATVTSSVLGFLAIPLFTRVFPPSEYGIYSLVVIAVQIVSPFLYVWLSSSSLRFYPEYKKDDELDVFYSTVLHYFPHFLGFVLLVLVPLAAFVLPLGENRAAVCVGVVLFAFYTIYMVLIALIRARQLAKQYALLYIMAPVGRYLVGAAMVAWFKLGVAGALMGWLGVLLITVPLELIFLRIHRYFSLHKVSRRALRQFFSFGFVLAFTNLFANALISGDRYILQFLKGSAQVGVYSVAYALTFGVAAVASDFILLSSVPVLMKTYVNEGEAHAARLINRLTRYQLLVLTPCLVGLYVLRDDVFHVLTTPKYFIASQAILGLVIGLFFEFFSALPLYPFYFKKKTKLILIPFGIATAANIGLNFLFIPMWGFKGCAWATALSYLLQFVIVVILSSRYMKWQFPWADAAKILTSNAVMAACLFGMAHALPYALWSLVVMIAAGGLIYLAFFLIIGGITASEKEFARSMAAKAPLVGGLFKRGGK